MVRALRGIEVADEQDHRHRVRAGAGSGAIDLVAGEQPPLDGVGHAVRKERDALRFGQDVIGARDQLVEMITTSARP